jgi:hypothetical protein
MVPYWVDQSPSQGVFPKKTLSKSCNDMRWMGVMTFGHGVLDISRAHIVSFMGAFVEGVLHPRLQCNIFPSPLFAINLLWSKTLSAMCNGK